MSVSIQAIYEKVKQRIGKTERVKLGTIRERDFQRFAVLNDCKQGAPGSLSQLPLLLMWT